MHSVLEGKIYRYLEPAFIAVGYTAEQIAFGYENGAALIDDYITMTITGSSKDLPVEVLDEYLDNPGLTVEEHMIYRGEIAVAIDFYGTDTLRKAQRVKARLASSDQILLAERENLGFVGFTQTQSLPRVMEQAYEERSVFTLNLNYTEVETITVGTIGQVRVTGVDEDDEVIVDETIQEPGFVAP